MKIIAFFARNEDEELSIQDVAEKFEVTYATAQRALLRLHKNNWLERREDGLTSLYAMNPEAAKYL